MNSSKFNSFSEETLDANGSSSGTLRGENQLQEPQHEMQQQSASDFDFSAASAERSLKSFKDSPDHKVFSVVWKAQS